MGESQFGPLQQIGGGQYQADDQVARYVSAVGHRVAEFSDRSLPYEFVVVNDSTPNAWALPGGKIGIHRGLLVELENGAELAAVLGHEIVHAAAKHSANQIQRELLLDLVNLGVAYAVDDSKHAREIVAATNIGRYLASRKFDRDEERTADHHGIKYMHLAGYDTSAAVTLQEKFVAMDEAKRRRSGWLDGLFTTHPPSRERVANNRAALLQYPPGGDLGEASFRVHMRTLFEDREAYALADQARENLTRNPTRALQLIEQAIDQQPRESLFYGIRGDIYANDDRYQDAVDSYTIAIDRNARYFAHYLGRGLLLDEMGYETRARNDLRQSNQLFQTPIASFILGRYALNESNRAEAKRLFEFSSEATGELGKQALNEFVRLDIEDAPWRYLDVEVLYDEAQIVVEVSNSSGYPIEDILVRLQIEINGETTTRRLGLDHLDSGYYDVLESSVHYREEDDVKVRAKVVQAMPGW